MTLPRPPIAITLQAPERAADPALARRKNALYVAAVERAGGDPRPIDETATDDQRRAAFGAMAGLLLSGGADIDPARYGQPVAGSVDLEPGRDALEWAAWLAALERRRPILGICRGLQVINVFAGGQLLQDVGGHTGAPYGAGPTALHPLHLEPGSRLAGILGPSPTGATEAGEAGEGATDEPDRPDGATVAYTVNSYHHQAVCPAGLGRGLRASAFSPWSGPDGRLVEGLESTDPDTFLVAVQCHPERVESSPPAFARLFAALVEAARAG